MLKIKLVTWGFEFINITAIGIILQKDIPLYWVIVPVLFIIGIKVYEYKLDIDTGYSNVKAQLFLLLKLLSEEQLIDLNHIRCTYHAPTWFGKYYQTFNYIPHGTGGGRILTQKQGITGKTFTEKKPLVENFQNDEEYRQKMLSDYNYSSEELKEVSQDRRSYFTYPIVDETNKVFGVIYLDSPIVDTFIDDFDNSKMKKIIHVCNIIRDGLL